MRSLCSSKASPSKSLKERQPAQLTAFARKVGLVVISCARGCNRVRRNLYGISQHVFGSLRSTFGGCLSPDLLALVKLRAFKFVKEVSQ